MEVSLEKIEISSRNVLENLFQYYIYNMSEFMEWSPNEDGKYGFNQSQFDAYWTRHDHFPYFILYNSELAGFTLVRRYPTNNLVYDIEQFFVLRKFKGNGVGKKALQSILNLYPGEWQIRVLLENTKALHFWKSAVSNVVGCNYTLSKEIDVDLQMNFIRFNNA